MEKLSRRSFLGGVLALSVAAAAAPVLALADVPVIYGDGVHDDWAGLQAMFDGRPFRVTDGAALVATEGVLNGGIFSLSKTLVIRGSHITIQRAAFNAADDFEGEAMLRVHGDGCVIAHCVINGRGAASTALRIGA